MTPHVGKIYLEPKSMMVVECVQQISGVDPSQMFRGIIVSPGRLAEFHAVGDSLPTLNAAAFQLVGASRDSFFHEFRNHIVQTNPMTTDEALLSMGGFS